MVKEGYKQTEIGVIPEDWEAVQLGKLAKVRMCKRIFAEQTTEEGDIPFYKIGTFGGKPDAYISRKLYEEYKSKYSYPKPGDILVSAAGTLGRTVVYDGKDAYYQDSNIVWLDVDKSILCNEYLKHYYKVIKWASSEGSTISRLYNGIIESTYIAYPKDLKEQSRIAEALSDIDELISSLEKLIAKKKAIKQGAMQQLLTGKTRLPGYTDEWVKIKLEDVCSITARMVSPIENQYHMLPHIGNEAIEKGTGAITHFNLVKDDNLISGKYFFGESEVLYGKINPQFAKAAYPRFCGLCSADMYPLACSDRILPEYLLQILLSESFTHYTVSLSKRSGIPKVNREELMEYSFHLPSIGEQRQISRILAESDQSVEELHKKLAKIQIIKQGMMQQLLTGKIRLV